MKFHVIILCVCLAQICSGLDSDTIRFDRIKGVSDQFIADFNFVREKMGNNIFIRRVFDKSYLEQLETISRYEDGNNHLNVVRSYQSFYGIPLLNRSAEFIDAIKLAESVLSKSVPKERYSGLINLIFTIPNPNATDKQIESSLGYLFGTETAEIKTTYVDDLPLPAAAECTAGFKRFSKAIEKLESMVDLKPKVIDDAVAIRDKFSCDTETVELLERFAHLLGTFKGDQSKIQVCTVEKNMEQTTYDYVDVDLLECILPMRLSDETTHGMMNFIKTVKMGATADQIQKALEYLYDDVPTEKCESNIIE